MPAYFAEPSTLVVISYKDVLSRLKDFLLNCDCLAEEDVEELLSHLLLSYFTLSGDRPEELVYKYLTNNGFPVDECETQNAEVILALLEEIENTTRQHIPLPFNLGILHGETLQVEDVVLRNKNQLVITLASSTVIAFKEMLKKEQYAARHSNRRHI
jgi:hypothetical protein